MQNAYKKDNRDQLLSQRGQDICKLKRWNLNSSGHNDSWALEDIELEASKQVQDISHAIGSSTVNAWKNLSQGACGWFRSSFA